ncbi:MAG TPA: UbiA family prenyltransferase [Verrucomicrobiae bacterium]|jgi:4-hydroxybenzoate polyprenyltransferase|nr:UbiA family prenyltransferase [Verrucomicrobiae bacterium]
MRTLLVLARVSNLPTVWTNCLAAWLLAGGAGWQRFSILCLGASLLYTAGMFLNDAIDQEFDRRYRPERPIVSGQISSLAVWVLSGAFLISGCFTFALLGGVSLAYALALAATIVLYDLVHKRTTLSPVFMAACRFLLYLLAASVLYRATSPDVVWPAVALAAYIAGLSYLARGESTGGAAIRSPVVLLFLPAAVALLRGPRPSFGLWCDLLLQVGWTTWCLCPRRPAWAHFIPQSIPGLLAGIALVDLLAATGRGFPAFFLSCFVLAIVLQRIAPAS